MLNWTLIKQESCLQQTINKVPMQEIFLNITCTLSILNTKVPNRLDLDMFNCTTHWSSSWYSCISSHISHILNSTLYNLLKISNVFDLQYFYIWSTTLIKNQGSRYRVIWQRSHLVKAYFTFSLVKSKVQVIFNRHTMSSSYFCYVSFMKMLMFIEINCIH